MKILFPLLTSSLFLITASVQAQDTTSRKPQPAPSKVATTGQNTDTNPIINKIAVSDPGMPPERPASTTKSAGTKPKEKEKKRKGNSGVTPK